MMKRFAITVVAAIVGVVTAPYFAYADYPHTGTNSNGINCINCHTVHGALPDWVTAKDVILELLRRRGVRPPRTGR